MDRLPPAVENGPSAAMELVTLESGPVWKMQVLLGLLKEHGVLAFVHETNLGPYGIIFPAHLRVPADAVETARAVLAEQRAQSPNRRFDS